MLENSFPSIEIATLALADALHPLAFLAPVAGVLALITAFLLYRGVMTHTEGDEQMVRIAEAVRQGAKAYLNSQYKVVFLVFIGLMALLGLIVYAGLEPIWAMVGVPIAGFLSAVCGWFGMKMATNASARTAAACRKSLNDGLRIAFRSGAVMGLVCVGFALLDVSFWFFVFSSFGGAEWLPEFLRLGDGDAQSLLNEMVAVLISFKMGASLQALFARVGGGIFTKAADVGADLVGKVEAGIPEDDARNPAVIADNVGDNVGDVAGMGADLYESYYSSIIAAIGLGVAAAFSLLAITAGTTEEITTLGLRMATMPIVLASIGIFASIVGVFVVRTKDNASFHELMNSLHKGVYVASLLVVAAAFAVPFFLIRPLGEIDGVVDWWRFGASIVSGLVAGLVIAWWTERCTSYEHEPTKRIARQAITGPATVMISGLAEGMKSTWACLLAVVVAILFAYGFAGGNENFLMGLFGVGIAAVGMLSTLGITLATDAYGPIADNAGGNAEMSGQPPEVRERTDMLDSIGNTTAATGKGFAIGSAALTAMALLAAYVQVVQTQIDKQIRSEAEVALAAYQSDHDGADPTEPFAQYLGYGQFAVVIPDGRTGDDGVLEPLATGALLVDRQQLNPGELATVPRGARFPLMPDPRERQRFETLGRELSLADKRGLVASIDLSPDNDSAERTDVRIVNVKRASLDDVLGFYNVTLTNPTLLGGLFIGVMLTFLFCAMTMDAVGRAANVMMMECRRQFGKMREGLRAHGTPEEEIADPERWPMQVHYEGVDYPDYPRCVEIATTGALREMVVPSLLVVLVPVACGLVLSVSGVMGVLAGGLITGFAMAVFMANSGGAWDNAKKLLESYGRITADQFLADESARGKVPEQIRDAIHTRAEEMQRTGHGHEYVYGKGSEDHKATVVGDTVGDPFKDTSGPSLNILIKLLSSVAVVASGVTVKFGPVISGWLGM
ncbi:MAG: sodium/proton-translocating pyrophosphatase [Planctomycetota bacterium]